MEKSKGILDELRRIVGCLYISDLHDSGRFEQVKKIENVTEAQVRSLFEKL